ncbi:MAG: nucleotide exchange factor GrpE [Polyangiaceae bacterium]|nr:nucleotide exchange factor GrpE [Polyangiaceae bacterium]MBK8940507.1 nucleotide exchange factor GrpE [Polyangiaceae bacterium]
MSDDADKTDTAGQTPADATGSSGTADGELAIAEPEVVAAPDPLEVAKAEAQKYREQLLRTAADFDNFRKRSRRENEDSLRKGRESTVKELLPVFDNLERALSSADGAPDVKSVADGLRMVVRQFSTTLEKIGIKRIQSVGAAFDPSLHEAIQHVESTEHEAGVVAAEVQPGYMIGEHLLRAAMVVVSKGGPAAAEDAPAGEEQPS